MFDDRDLTGIQDERAPPLLVRLLNLLEDVTADLRDAQGEIQRRRDENNRRKGEQGTPTIKANIPTSPPTDHSSERERRQPGPWSKGRKNETIGIDRHQVLAVDPALLPPDAEFTGYEVGVVQEVVFRTETIRFLKEQYSAPSTSRPSLAPVPRGYDGQFGPGLTALTLGLDGGGQRSEPKILELGGSGGVQISAGQLSNVLIKDQDVFHTERDAVDVAGLQRSPWQPLDATGTRVHGQNHHWHIVCHPRDTASHTTPSKERLSVLDVLRNGQPRTFRGTAEALGTLEQMGLSGATHHTRARVPREQDWDDARLRQGLEEHLPPLGPQQRKWMLAATAVAADHAPETFPVVRLWVGDDAPPCNGVTAEWALCWVHEGRHSKKLTPSVPHHRRLLDDFLERFWTFYDALLTSRQQPTAAEHARLAAEFEGVGSTVTGSRALDERIATTQAKKACLLMVLAPPEIPLHTNPAELGARMRVRKRDVSVGPRTADGAQAWDTFMTLAATAKKLGGSFYHYIHARISGANQMPGLASLLERQAKDLNLGASWNTS